MNYLDSRTPEERKRESKIEGITTTSKTEGWEEEFDKEFPPFTGIGARFPIFDENPNRNHIIQFIRQLLSQKYDEGYVARGVVEAKIKEGMEQEFKRTLNSGRKMYEQGIIDGKAEAINILRRME